MILIGSPEVMSLLSKVKVYADHVGLFLLLRLSKVLTAFTEMSKYIFQNNNLSIAHLHMEIMVVMEAKWILLLIISKIMAFPLKNNTLILGDNKNVKKTMETIK